MLIVVGGIVGVGWRSVGVLAWLASTGRGALAGSPGASCVGLVGASRGRSRKSVCAGICAPPGQGYLLQRCGCPGRVGTGVV